VYGLLFLLSAVLVASQVNVSVYVSILFNSVSKIDGVEQDFSCDFYISAYWYDPCGNQSNPFDPTQNFIPGLEFSNVLGAPDTFITNSYYYLGLQADGGLDGLFTDPSSIPFYNATNGSWMGWDQRYFGSFSTPLMLQDFPFDRQSASLTIDSYLWAANQVIFLPLNPPTFGAYLFPNDFSIIEWIIEGPAFLSYIEYYPVYQQYYSILQIDIQLRRDPVYYLYKVVAGSLLLVYMCVFIFSIEVHESDRLMGTLTIFLGLISFVFVSTQDIPKVAYNTRIDVFTAWSYFLVFFMSLSHGVLYFYRPGEAAEQSEESKKVPACADPFFIILGLPPWNELTTQRKADFILAIFYFVSYNIGVAAILSRSVSSNSSLQPQTS